MSLSRLENKRIIVDPREALSEFRVEEGAFLSYIEVQKDPGAAREREVSFMLSKDSRLEALFVTLGGTLVKNKITVRFTGEGGEASLKGLSLLDGGSQISYDMAAEHLVPHCRSGQFYKSIVAGRARSEFYSLVSVRPGAQGSDSRQLSKNLLLSDTAHASARPQLHILADDVSCQHGATVGPLADEELFYLRSRGLAHASARLLMIRGFAGEVLEGITDEGLRNDLKLEIETRLEEIVR